MTNQNPREIRARTFQFARDVTLFVIKLEDRQVKRTLGDQLMRSATSVGANLEEADGAISRNDFIYNVNTAKKEAREASYWLRLFEATKIVSAGEINRLIRESDELVRILVSIVNSARKVSIRHSEFGIRH